MGKQAWVLSPEVQEGTEEEGCIKGKEMQERIGRECGRWESIGIRKLNNHARKAKVKLVTIKTQTKLCLKK